MHVLVTNDDGVDAPGLVALARAMKRLGTVTVVVPDRERSWVGKAITRFDPVTAEWTDRGGEAMLTVSGYPADAVQIGLHSAPELPDLVVSGINLGYNHGAGFLMSSGTVGAAVEAWIAGVPAVAISTGTMTDWRRWRSRAESPEEQPAWERLADVTIDLIQVIEGAGLFQHADVVSINLPYESTGETERRVTTIARVGYDRLFSMQAEGVYVHDYGGGITQFEAVEHSDIAAAHDGAVSITPILMPAAALVPDEVRAAIEGPAAAP